MIRTRLTELLGIACPVIQSAMGYVSGAGLAAAVSGIGGAERPGQVAMDEAVERSVRSGEHLAVQAGTGTGKSLAYLVPAVAHALASGSAVVVATATIALCGIKFFFQNTVRRDWTSLKLLRPPRSKKLPVVLSRQEVNAIHGQLQSTQDCDESDGVSVASCHMPPPSVLTSTRRMPRVPAKAIPLTCTGPRVRLAPRTGLSMRLNVCSGPQYQPCDW